MYMNWPPTLSEVSWFLIAFGICFLLICMGISMLRPDAPDDGDGVP